VGAAGIGGGHTDVGTAAVDDVVVAVGQLEATGGDGAAAIGCGTTARGSAAIVRLTVSGGALVLHGDAGLHADSQLSILGGGDALNIDCDVVDGPCLSSRYIVLGSGSLNGSTNGLTFFEAGDSLSIAKDGSNALFSITGIYTRDSKVEPLGDLPRIRIAQLPECGRPPCSIEVKADGESFTKSLADGKDVVGAIISVPSPGDYIATISGAGGGAPSQKTFTVDFGETEVSFATDRSGRQRLALALGVTFGAIGAIAIVLVVVYVWRRRRYRQGLQPLPGQESVGDVDLANKWDAAVSV
jgi:hypothetical protein